MIEFKYPNEELIKVESKSALLTIVFSSGRVENCVSDLNLAEINGIEDWDKVIITTNIEDIKGLSKVGEVVGKSGWGGLLAQRKGNKASRKKLKQMAAELGAPIVLIQQDVSGFGGGKIIGIA